MGMGTRPDTTGGAVPEPSGTVSSKRVSSLWAFVVVVSAAKRNGCRCRNRLFAPIKKIDDDNDNEHSRWMNET